MELFNAEVLTPNAGMLNIVKYIPMIIAVHLSLSLNESGCVGFLIDGISLSRPSRDSIFIHAPKINVKDLF